MKPLLAVVMFAVAALGQSTTASQQPPPEQPSVISQLRNHQVVLAPPTPSGTAYTPFVSPDGKLVFFPTMQIVEKINAGYRPFTFGELQDALSQLVSANQTLTAELSELKAAQRAQTTSQPEQRAPTDAELQAARAQQQAYARQQAEAQRRQLIMMYFLGMQPKRSTVDVNATVTDCTKYPALCVRP